MIDVAKEQREGNIQVAKTFLLQEILTYLESKGVKGKGLKKRITQLKKESLLDLRSSFSKLKEFYGEKKDKTQYDKDGFAIQNNKTKEKVMNSHSGTKKEGTGKEEPTSKLIAMQEKIDVLRKLTPEKLIAIGAEGEFEGVKFKAVAIDPKLCKGDIFRMVTYPIQDAMGLGSEKADKAKKELNSPKYQEESKSIAASEKKESSKKSGPKKPGKESTTVDGHGFRVGTKGSDMFEALLAGVSDANLKKVGGAAVGGFVSGIKKDPKVWPAGRMAVIARAGDMQQITGYVQKDGTPGKCKAANKDLKAKEKAVAAATKEAEKKTAADKKAKEKAKADKVKAAEKEAKAKAAAKAKKDKAKKVPAKGKK